MSDRFRDTANPVVALLQSSREAFCAVDREWRYIYVNSQAEKLTGLAREQLLGRTIWDVWPDAVGGPDWQALHRAMNENVVVDFRQHYVGSDVWLDVRACPSDLGIAIYFNDVTAQMKLEEERQRAIDAMRVSEHRYRALVEATATVVWSWNPRAGRAESQRLHQWWQSLTGQTPEQQSRGFVGWIDALVEEDRARVADEWNTALRDGTPLQLEYRLRALDGAIHHISSRMVPIRDEAGAVLEWVGLLQDVTPQKHLEEQRGHSEEHLRQALDAGNCGIYEWEIEADRVTWSDRIYEFFGITREQFDGTAGGYIALVHPDDRAAVRESVERALRGEGVHRMEYRAVRPNGDVRWIYTNSGVMRDKDARPVRMLGACIDVTDRKAAEEALKRAKADAENANKAKDHFLAVLSHELRTPLTPVVMTVAALEMDRSLSPSVREDLAMIRRNIELETKLIDDLLDVTRIANGKLRLQPRPTCVHTLMRNVLEILRCDIAENTLHVTTDLSADDAQVSADPARLQQIFWNLVKNAIKFTPAGGNITIRTFNPGIKSVIIEVKDNGAGIDPEVLPRIFDAFDQGEQSITRQFGGLGLGLAISKALTDLHGGKITVHSDGKGTGATFSVELPTLGAITRMVDQIQPLPANQHGTRVRVLLVEDHLDTQRALQRLLEDRGYVVTAAGSVAAALSALGEGASDIVLSDIGLPDGTGHELMRQVGETYHIPGIALSGFGMDGDLRQSHDAGFAAHLTKPVDLAQLDSAIRSLTSAQLQHSS